MGEQAPSAVPAYIASLVRHAVTLICGYFIGKGLLTGAQADAFAGAAIAAVPLIWSLVQKKQVKDKLQAAIDAPAGSAQL